MPQLVSLPDDHMISSYGVMLFEPKHRVIKKLNKHYKPSVHGHKTWLSSFLLMDYLMHTSLLNFSDHVLELGCGWGPASIFCAQRETVKVTALDCDKDVFPYLEVMATLNEVEINTKVKKFEKLTKKDLSEYSIMLGADICFWDDLVQTHKKLIKRALKAGVKHIVLTDPGRSTFVELAEHCIKEYGAQYYEWYSTEPEQFEGFVLHISVE